MAILTNQPKKRAWLCRLGIVYIGTFVFARSAKGREVKLSLLGRLGELDRKEVVLNDSSMVLSELYHDAYLGVYSRGPVSE
ncbi:hypothetical protein TNCV_1694251 [Trichonephila clavipes]|nr:hypothetical protein TNCV_1694251 [Trichonephila clavipes]